MNSGNVYFMALATDVGFVGFIGQAALIMIPAVLVGVRRQARDAAWNLRRGGSVERVPGRLLGAVLPDLRLGGVLRDLRLGGFLPDVRRLSRCDRRWDRNTGEYERCGARARTRPGRKWRFGRRRDHTLAGGGALDDQRTNRYSAARADHAATRGTHDCARQNDLSGVRAQKRRQSSTRRGRLSHPGGQIGLGL